GNNNAYCQDNEVSWVDWDLDGEQRSLTEFTRRIIALRAGHPVLRRRRFFHGETPAKADRRLPDLVWLRPDAREMADQDWQRDDAYSVGVFLNGDAIAERDAYGRRVVDDSFLILLNGYWEPVDFRLPGVSYGERWTTLIDTADPDGVPDERERKAGSGLRVESRSLILLSRPSQSG
ncbi:glycogen debranching enzyme, partial [Streptomyces sp. SID4985]|nr:glycogen debranching enzyme [Streptomyces sp. SID4985]